MTINREDALVGTRRRQKLVAAASLLGALAASSCCVLPLLLFALGVSGAWIGNLTRLAPYHVLIVAATFVCLGYGYWLAYRRSRLECTDASACAAPLPAKLVKAALIVATIMVLGAIAFDFIGPLLLTS